MGNYIELKGKCGIYAIVNKTNNKKYIGSSNDIYKRFITHKSCFKYKKENKYFQFSWEKYGEENFDLILVEECRQKDLLNKEKYWIEFYKACDTNFGYNVNPLPEKPPSWQGKKHSEETKKKIGEANKGRIVTQQQKEKTSKVHRGKKISEEHKEKLRKKNKGINNPMFGKTFYEIWVKKYGKEEADKKMKEKNEKARIIMTGKKLSDDAKKKISIKSTGRKHTKEAKEKMSKKRIGKKISEETRKKLSFLRTGEKNAACKIKNSEIPNIKKRLSKGENVQKIAKEYNVTKQCIYRIKKNKRKI